MAKALQNRAQTIGLFGGSFNPAHQGHLHVANCGLQQLGLDQIWWMVSPQNPLKPKQPPYEQRVATVDALGLPPRMHISHMEMEFGTNYTVQTLRRAKKRWPRHRFVFLMGADNLRQLPQWRGWREIMESVPIAVIARPEQKTSDTLKARLSQAARSYDHARIPESQAHALVWHDAPAWTYLTPPMSTLSSSAIRAAKDGETT
ncbi:MAG: nicotinic acid mononucleotide adenylyltransferase [Robiginitomaculum sp.]|nr:MAG: nicotinic acid mononucleotide adenylyltransferase [Robiginitomaculum sp.]